LEQLLTVKDLANLWKVSPKTVYRRVWKEKVPHIKLGRAIRFRPSDIQRYLGS
jgi:excisionase family DNA binding protein